MPFDPSTARPMESAAPARRTGGFDPSTAQAEPPPDAIGDMLEAEDLVRRGRARSDLGEQAFTATEVADPGDPGLPPLDPAYTQEPEEPGYLATSLKQLPARAATLMGNLMQGAGANLQPKVAEGGQEIQSLTGGLGDWLSGAGEDVASIGADVRNPEVEQLAAAVQRGDYGEALSRVPQTALPALMQSIPDLAMMTRGAAPLWTEAMGEGIEQEHIDKGGEEGVRSFLQSRGGAALMTALNRFSLDKILGGLGKGAVPGAARGVAAEAPTEAIQEAVEYLATTFGTDEEVAMKELTDAGIIGGLVGAGPGAALGAGAGAMEARQDREGPGLGEDLARQQEEMLAERLGLPAPPPIEVTPEGEARTPEQQRQREAEEGERAAMGLTPDVEQAAGNRRRDEQQRMDAEQRAVEEAQRAAEQEQAFSERQVPPEQRQAEEEAAYQEAERRRQAIIDADTAEAELQRAGEETENQEAIGQPPVNPAMREAFERAQEEAEAVEPALDRRQRDMEIPPDLDRRQGDRRQDLERRRRVSEMSADELRQELLTNEVTGIPNRRAYEEAEKLPTQVSMDVDSLKWVNDEISHQAGDELLRAVGEVLAAETDQAFHISGDEFVSQAATDEEADAVMQRVNQRLADAQLEFTKPDGTVVTLDGVGLSYGTGGTLADADTGLQNQKREREAGGLRASRGERPPSASVRAAVSPGTDRGAGPAARDDAEGQAAAPDEDVDALSLGAARVESDADADTHQSLEELQQEIHERLTQVGISEDVAGKAEQEILAQLRSGKIATARGTYGKSRGHRLIRVAMADPEQQTKTLNHEIIHALRDLGLFTAAEWRILARAAEANTEIMEGVRRRYARANLSEDKLIEEAVADLHGAWVAGRLRGQGKTVRRVLDRITEFLRAIHDVFTGRGLTTADQVFEAIDQGKVGKRPRRTRPQAVPSQQDTTEAERAELPLPEVEEQFALGEDTMRDWRRQIQAMSRSREGSFTVKVQAPLILRHLGIADEVAITLNRFRAIHRDHPDLPMSVFGQLPGLLADPVLIYRRGERAGQGHRETNVVVETVTAEGNPILVGIKEGRIRTITPHHGRAERTGKDHLRGEVARGEILYARNDEALNEFRAPDDDGRLQVGTIPSPDKAGPGPGRRKQKVVFRADIVNDPDTQFDLDQDPDETLRQRAAESNRRKAARREALKQGRVEPRTTEETFTPPGDQRVPHQDHSSWQSVAATQFLHGYDPTGAAMPHFLKDSLIGFQRLFESASDRLRRIGMAPMAELVDRVFDTEQRNAGRWNEIMAQPVRDATAADKRAFAEWAESWDQKQDQQAQAVYDRMSETGQALVDAWRAAADMTGKENQRVGVQVFDAKLGKMRPIGRAANYYPRKLQEWAQNAMHNPVDHPQDKAKLVNLLIEKGLAENAQDAEKFIRTNGPAPDKTSNDYFSAMEKARTDGFPPEVYDYTLDTALDYGKRWSERLAQIETLGQDGTQFGEAFDAVINEVQQRDLKQYLRRVKARVYNEAPIDPIGRLVASLNMLATGTQLGNPRTAMQNLITGSGLNYVAYGRFAGKAQLDALRLEPGAVKEAEAAGVLRDDILQVQRDLAESTNVALSNFTGFTMRFGGYNITERQIRLQAYLAGRHFVRKLVTEVGKNPMSGPAKRYIAWMQRNNFDYEEVLAEGGKGPATDRVLRYIVNMPQGSYKVNMTPVLIDEPMGRFFFKYQKYGTQVTRMVWMNHMQPFIRSLGGGEKIQVRDPVSGQMVDRRAFEFMSMLRLILLPPIYGYANKWTRWAAFGTLFALAGPDWEDIEKALEDEDLARAAALALELAWESVLVSGILGIFQTPVQIGRDVSEMKSIRNPLDPPGLGALKATWGLVDTLYNQGTLTAGDIDFWTLRTFSIYNATVGSRPGRQFAASMGFEDKPALEAYRLARATVQKEVRSYAQEFDLKSVRRRGPTGFAPTPQTPVNRDIADSIILGRPAEAKAKLKAYLDTLDNEADVRAAISSVKTHVRNKQPIVVGGQFVESDRRNFLDWASQNLHKDKYARIVALDRQYRRAAQAAGLLARDNPKEQARTAMRRAAQQQELSPGRRARVYRQLGVQ